MVKVLLVDNDAISRKQYILGLQTAGYDAVAASSAQAALDALDEIKPDVMVLDIALPVHNGITVVYEMMSYPDWSQIPVIILSAIPRSDFTVSDELWKQLNIVRYCHKPETRPSRLANVISEVME